ncbi:MAG: N-acetylmuramoyl-L-alanine amidase [Bacteroidales bacterium]|nr:N-acetylmuramoyl-L-alanine amidase [Bacteroidales bacterium]
MGRKTIFILLAWMATAAAALADGHRFTLVVDAGHGGHDAGAKGAFSYEKNINLNVALAFGRLVEDNCPDVRVIYTRKTDVFVPLHRRAEIANKNKADVFISIHTNALPAGHVARGLETYTMGMRRSDEKLSAAMRENSVIMIEKDYKERYEGYDPNSPESTIMFEFLHDRNMSKSVELAKLVQRCVCATATRQNKGVKQDVFLVLRETSMPACLIELGFITTADEEQYLNKAENVDKIAEGIYQAFVTYRKKYDEGFTVPYDPEMDSKASVNPVNKPQVEKSAPRPQADKPANKPQTRKTATGSGSRPVFKVQIIASSRSLRPGSGQFKGLTGVESYEENGMVKYTYGASTDYNEIYRLRKSILDKFPEAFIIAFKDGVKTDINKAIREFKSNR